MTRKSKRIAIIIFSLLFVLIGLGAILVPIVKINSSALGGEGTDSSPYLINNADDLKAFRDSVNGGTTYEGKYVLMTSDIDLKYALFAPIGLSKTNPFKGNFDGGGHTVSGIYINRGSVVADQNHVGFFGFVSKGTIENLTLADVNICAYSAAGKAGTVKPANSPGGNGANAISLACGGVAGRLIGATLSNCHVTGLVQAWGGNGGAGGEGGVPSSGAGKKGGNGGRGADCYTGGMVGISDGSTIEDCSFVGTVYAWGGAGGNGGNGSNAVTSGYVGGAGGNGGNAGLSEAGGIVALQYNDANNADTTDCGSVSRCYANVDLRIGASNSGYGGAGRSASGVAKGGNGGNSGQRAYLYGGGIVGEQRGDVTDCFSLGEMQVRNSVKGNPGNSGYGRTSSGTGDNFGSVGLENRVNTWAGYGGISGYVNAACKTKNVYSDLKISEIHFYSIFTTYSTRMGGISGVIGNAGATLENAVSLGKSYFAESTVTAGNAYSPIATFRDTAVRTAVQDSALNLRYVTDVTATNLNGSRTGDIVVADVNAMGERCGAVTADESLDLGGVFNGFDTNVWEVSEGVNGGRPVLKNNAFKEIPRYVFEVSTRDDLLAVAKKINSGFPMTYATLNINADIELGEWNPMGVGVNKTPMHFTVNGNGHTLSNMQVTKTTSYKGFIGYSIDLVVDDLTIEDPYITGSGGDYTGAVVGTTNWAGKIRNCHVTQSNKISGQNAIIRGSRLLGGIVGNLSGFPRGELINCSNSVKVHCVTGAGTATNLSVGGLAGQVGYNEVRNCYVTGDVVCDAYNTAFTYYAAALIGRVINGTNVRNCFATGNVTAPNEASFIGEFNQTARNCVLENCYFTGNVSTTFNNKSLIKASAIRAGGMIARISAISPKINGNVVLTAKHTFASNIKGKNEDSTNGANYLRFGNLYATVEPYGYNGYTATTSGSTTTYKAKELAIGYKRYYYIRDSVKTTTKNYYNSKVSWSKKAYSQSTFNKLEYYLETTAQCAGVDYYAKTSADKEAFWRDTVKYDFDNVWQWDASLGLPTLKTNEYKVAGKNGSEIEINTVSDLITLRTTVNAGNNYAGKTVVLKNDLDLSGITWTPIGKSTSVYFAGTFDGGNHTISNMYVNYSGTGKGLFGFVLGATIKDLTVKDAVITDTGITTSYNCVGGVCGWAQNSKFTNCHFVGGKIDVIGVYAGGIVGYSGGTSMLYDNCSSTYGDDDYPGLGNIIRGRAYVGGICGCVTPSKANVGTVKNSFSTRVVTATYGVAGGIAGASSGTNFMQNYFTGSVFVYCGNPFDLNSSTKGVKQASCGGIVGRMQSYSAKVENCLNYGTVCTYGDKGGYTVSAGGIVGEIIITGCSISNCFNAGDVLSAVTKQSSESAGTSNAYAGGIVGVANVATTTVGGCAVVNDRISSSNMLADSSHYAYAGYFGNGNTAGKPVQASGKPNYWYVSYGLSWRINADKGYNTVTHAGLNRTVDQFKQTSTYFDSTEPCLGWDMDTVWDRQDGVNNGFPYIRSLGVPVLPKGNKFNPIQINEKADFLKVNTDISAGFCYNGLYIKQNDDLNLAGVGRTGYDFSHSFAGVYDGCDHKVTGLNISGTTSQLGMFGYVKFAWIKNLALVKPVIKQTGMSVTNVGALIGYSLADLTVSRCSVMGGSVTTQGGYVGGMIGYANLGYNRILNSFSTATVNAGNGAGGLVGMFRRGRIDKCYAVANVTATRGDAYGAGGLVGLGEYITRLYDCYAKGNIVDRSTSTWAIAGGLVSTFHQNSNYIQRCYFVGTISATTTLSSTSNTSAHVGGMVGYSSYKNSNDQIYNNVSLATSITATATRATAYCQASQIADGAQAKTSGSDYRANNGGNYALSTVTGKKNNLDTRVQAGYQISDLEKFKTEWPTKFPDQTYTLRSGSTTTVTKWNFDTVWSYDPQLNDGLPMLRNMPADTSDLDALIVTARSYKAEDWNTETFAVLQKAIADAEENIAHVTEATKVEYIRAINEAIVNLRPERTNLQELYEDIITNKQPYSDWYVNFNTMNSALALAKGILDEDSNKYKNGDVILAYSTLLMADTNLVVDKFKLNEAIVKANNVVESDYKKEDWDGLQAEKLVAVSVNNNPDATAREVKEATEALERAILGLKIDKSKLEAKITEAYTALGGTVSLADGKVVLDPTGKLSDDKFDSMVAFDKAFTDAVTAYEDVNALGTTVSQAVYELGVALNNLTISKADLRNEYNNASLKQESQYTKGSWATFAEAYASAGEVLQKPNAKPNEFIAYSKEVDDALEALRTAIDGLLIDKQQLADLIAVAEAEKDNEDIYDPTSYALLMVALDEGKAVYDDANATASQISGAAVKLNDAILNLKINLNFLIDKIAEADVFLAEGTSKYYTDDTIGALKTSRDTAQACVDDCINAGVNGGEGTTAPDAETQKQLLQMVKTVTRDLLDKLDGVLANLDLLKSYVALATDEACEGYIGNVGYSAESVAQVVTIAQSAQTVIDDEARENDDVVKAIKDLEFAFANLKPDKSALSERVREVGKWTNSKHRQDNDGNWIMDENTGELKVFVVYSVATWDELQAKLALAEAVVNDPDATVEDVKQASENLETAISGLRIDTEELELRIQKAEGILAKTDIYTAETLAILDVAKASAVDTVANIVNENIDHVQEVLDYLVKCIDGVVVDPASVIEYINFAKSLDANKQYFTELSYNMLVAQTELVESMVMVKNPETGEEIVTDKLTEKDVTDFIKIIVDALNGLEIVTAELEEHINTAESFIERFVTAETFADLTSVTADAKQFLSSGDLLAGGYADKLSALEVYKTKLTALNGAIDGVQPHIDNYKAFIEEKKAILSMDYGAEGLTALQIAIKEAEDALLPPTEEEEEKEEFNYYVLIRNVEAINNAVDALLPDVSDLRSYIDEKTGILNAHHTEPEIDYDDEGNPLPVVADPMYIDGVPMYTYEYYTKTTYDAFLAEFAKAELIINNPAEHTVEDVQAELTALISAYEGLVIEKTLLNDLISECDKVNGSYYESASFASFSDQLTASKEYAGKVSGDVAEYVSEYKLLLSAKNGLIFDTSALDALIERANAIIANSQKEEGEEGKAYYTQSSLDNLQAMLEEANTFTPEEGDGGSEEGDATANVDYGYSRVCENLAGAIDAMVDLTELVNKINLANTFVAENPNENRWTEESYQTLLDAIATAQTVRDDEKATNEAVAEQVAILSDIEGMLVEYDPSADSLVIIEANTHYAFVDADGKPAESHSGENPAYLINVALNDTVADVLTQFKNTGVKVFRSDGTTEITDFENTAVATGMILRVYKNDAVIDEAVIVVKCDVNGDGKINAVDKAQINASFTGKKALEGAYKLACDVNGDGKINAVDKAQINAQFTGKKNIFDGLSVHKDGE